MRYGGKRALFSGVALIVENPEGEILILQENRYKFWARKYKRMSIPMETPRWRESNERTLNRLIAEELGGLAVSIEPWPRGFYRSNFAIFGVRLYVGRALTNVLPVFNEQHEVSGHRWIAPQDALHLRLRRGTKEILSDYIVGYQNVLRTF